MAMFSAVISGCPFAGFAQPTDTEIHTRSAAPSAEPRKAEKAEEAAIDVSAVYTADLWRNARGGIRQGARYLDNVDLTLTIDAERALGLSDTTLFFYGLYNNGKSLTDDLVGDLQVVSNIDAGTRAFRLYEAWIERRFADDRASVKVGLYDLNSEFDASAGRSLFINSSHGIGPDFSQSGLNGPSIFPVTSLALRVDYKLTDNWLVRAAVLDGVPGDPTRPKRTAIKLGNRDAALIAAEVEYSDSKTEVAAGTWRYTAQFEDILATELAGERVLRSGNMGAYILGERKLTGGAIGEVGLSGWTRFGVADGNFNSIKRFIGAGIVYTGIVPGRAEDQLGVAVGAATLGARFRRARALAGESTDGTETNIEVTYRAPIAPWLIVQPDLQYVINPGASPALRNAVVAGLRVEVGF